MRYLLLIYEPTPGGQTTEAEVAGMFAEYAGFTKDIAARGLMHAAGALQPATTATTVRVREGRTLVTDGPFAETKETLGGYYLVECADLDEAIELAARIPGARGGSIEIRPVLDMPEEYTAAVAEASSVRR